MKYICDNISNAHDPITTGEDYCAIRVLCRICKETYIIPKDFNLSPEKRMYARIFKRDILQPKENLFYKIYPHYLIK